MAAGPAASQTPSRDDGLDRIPADPDLVRIPSGAEGPPTSARYSRADNIYVQGDLALYDYRGVLVPPPQSRGPSWKNLLFLDVREQWAIGPGVSLTYSGRLNAEASQGERLLRKESFRHDLREAYVAIDLPDQTFLQIGRINLKSGVALGFNPTDFFKTRAVVEPLSADPSVLREDRLGALMVLGQHVSPAGALTLAFAPRLERATPIYGANNLPSFDPVFDRTNSSNRFLAKASLNLPGDFSPELVIYGDRYRHAWGLNLTHGFGQSVVGYLEWAGERRASLIDNALRYGRETGALPSTAPSPLPESSKRAFETDLAIGATYITPSKIMLSLEYQHHEAGLSGDDWTHWFDAGALQNPRINAELWYIRAYASDQREPISRDSAFLRMNRQDAFIHNLELSGFINVDAHDGSGIAQASADYYVSRQWTLGSLASATFGGHRSDFGSLPGAANFLVKATRYF